MTSHITRSQQRFICVAFISVYCVHRSVFGYWLCHFMQVTVSVDPIVGNNLDELRESAFLPLSEEAGLTAAWENIWHFQATKVGVMFCVSDIKLQQLRQTLWRIRFRSTAEQVGYKVFVMRTRHWRSAFQDSELLKHMEAWILCFADRASWYNSG